MLRASVMHGAQCFRHFASLRGQKVGFEPGGESLLHLLQFAGEEMIRSWDHDQIGRWRRAGHHGFHPSLGPVLISVAADKELGLGAAGEKAVVILASPGFHGKPERHNALDPLITAAGAQTNAGAEGEAGEEHRQVVLPFQPVERGAHIAHLAAAVVVRALAQAGAAKIEAQHRQPISLEGLHGVIDDLVVHGSAEERVRMANHGRVGGIGPPHIQQSFEPAVRAAQIVDAAQQPGAGRGGVLMHRLYPKGSPGKHDCDAAQVS